MRELDSYTFTKQRGGLMDFSDVLELLHQVLTALGVLFAVGIVTSMLQWLLSIVLFIVGFRMVQSERSSPLQQRVGVGILIVAGALLLGPIFSSDESGVPEHAVRSTRPVPNSQSMVTGQVIRSCIQVPGSGRLDCVQSSDPEELARLSAEQRIRAREEAAQLLNKWGFTPPHQD
jgi:hypothetical protein